MLQVLFGPLSEVSELGDSGLSRYVCPGNRGANGVSNGLSAGVSSELSSAILSSVALSRVV